MVLLFYIALNLVFVYLLVKYRSKRMHPLELFVNGLFGSFLVQNYNAINSMNFKTFVIPDVLSLEFAHVLNRFVLFPVSVLYMLTLLLTVQSLSKKLLIVVCFECIFVGLEWLEDWQGVLIHQHWRLWWSFAVWLVIMAISCSMMIIFRKILRKEVPAA